MNLNIERKINSNAWLTRARWFYIPGIYFFSIIAKLIDGQDFNIAYYYVILIFVLFFLINLALNSFSQKLQRPKYEKYLTRVCVAQIFFDLATISTIIYAVGMVENISVIFFILPIIAASLLFGFIGSITTALSLVAIINLLILLEYYHVIPEVFLTEFELLSMPRVLAEVIVVLIFYLIVGFFSGYSANMIFKHEEEIKDKLKSEFVSVVIHQLRTPLTSIKWLIKMVLDGDAGPLNDEQRDLLENSYKSNEKIIVLVNDLLTTSRMEEGRFVYQFDAHDFHEVIDEIKEDMDSMFKKNQIDLYVEMPNNLPKVRIDKKRILLVLQNMLDNAIKYTPKLGRIEITVKKVKKFINVTVKDNGVGIPKGDQNKIFSKFFRGSNAVRMETEGTGLGLFLSKKIIEKHGGEISIKSKEGEGTEINFTLPIKA